MHINQSVSFLVIFLLLSSLSCVSAEETTIHVIDVGTGDAVLVESAGKYALIDAGPGRNTTADYLAGHNISSLDLFLVTSMDHGKTGGILEVMNRTVVHDFRDTGAGGLYPQYARVLEKIKNESIPHSILSEGDFIPIGTDAAISVVPVNRSATGGYDEAVLKIIIGNISMLLLSQNGSPDILDHDPIQILRVPDHGSRRGYDAGFIHRLRPEIAVISAGRSGDGPNKATVMGLEAIGAEVYRTDLKGTILIMTDGEKYRTGSSRSSPAGSISLISVIETRPPG
jgi:beta-lactamase superfamily II metal-dependent hydrolase